MDWYLIARDFGFPVTALIAVFLGIWRILVWIGYQIVIPMRDRHFVFLTKMEDSAISQAASMVKLVESNAQQRDSLADIQHKVESVFGRLFSTHSNGSTEEEEKAHHEAK